MAVGDIVQVLDTQGFVLYSGHPLKLCKRNKNIVVLLSQNVDTTRPLARAISINDSGTINATPTGSLILWDTHGRDPGLIHLGGNIFIAITNDHLTNVRLISFSVSDVGVIPGLIADDLIMGSAANFTHISDLLQPHAGIIIHGQCKSFAPGNIQTARVSGGGTFQSPYEDDLETSSTPYECRMRQAAGNRIVAAFSYGSHINICTFTCNSAGEMPDTPTDTWDSFTSGTNYLSLCKVTDLVYAILTLDDDDICRIRTFTINVDGSINKSFEDTEAVGTAGNTLAYMIEIGSGYFIVAYQVSGIPGRLKTYYISNTGVIQDGHISTLNIAESAFNFVSIVHLQGDIYALAFENTSTEIMIYTLEIKTPTDGVPHHEMMIGIGP